MCGLVAVLSKNKLGVLPGEVGLFETLLYLDAVRGWDSTGVIGVNKFGNMDWFKTRGTPQVLYSAKEYSEYSKKFSQNGMGLVGHNRKATVGEVADKTAHPFVEGTITAVHNGNISNYQTIEPNLEVDSMCIPYLLNREDYHTALDKLVGAFAIFWYNAETKKIHFCRNSQRPLAFVETSSSYIVASEIDMLLWAVGRSSYKIVKETIVQPGDVWTYDVTTGALSVETLVFNKPFPQTTKTHVGGKEPSGKVTSTTKLLAPPPGVGGKSTFLTGSTIVFELYDFKDAGVNSGYEYVGMGTTQEEPQREVRFFFDMDDMIEASETQLFVGKVSHFSKIKEEDYVWVVPDSVSEYIVPTTKKTGILYSLNKEEITNHLWNTMPKKCYSCAKRITKDDVEFCITDLPTTRRSKKKIWCPECSDKLQLVSYLH